MLSFKKLDVYQRTVEFLALTAPLYEELTGNAALRDQLKRATSSIILNIAEGAGRMTSADAARSYAFARGSAMECAAVLDVLLVLKLIDEARHTKATLLIERIVGMLSRMCWLGRNGGSSTSPSTSTTT